MTIKSLLFILFLCICLVWVGAAYLHPGQDFQRFGLLWTALVLIAALAAVIGARLFGWWRLWRARSAARPPAPGKAPQAIHEDDAALAVLVAEAKGALAKAPNYRGAHGKPAALPLYLLIGPERSGKTSTFLNSGIEPQLLAGTGAGTGPTRLCNLWLAKNAIFAEISGRVFGGEIGRWSELLSGLRGKPSRPLWRRLWNDPEEWLALRGVVGFCEVKELTGAAADPQQLERRCRQWQERLRAIGEVFGVEVPVYQIFTKCDEIPFFSDFFGRLPESEANQVLGCTLTPRKPDSSRPGEVFAEAEAKRFAAAFRPLYHSLAERRLTHLTHEPNPARKPGIYEFPRELKRIRAPLVQFLTDVFRPHPLRAVPFLRGFYLTAIQEVEAAAAIPAGSRAEWTSPNAGMEATRLFRGDATQIFNPDEPNKGAGRGRKGIRWIFASDLFHQVILPDVAGRGSAPKDAHLERYRRWALGAVCGLCLLLCIAFLTSWRQNRGLLYRVAEAARAEGSERGTANLASVSELRSLEGLRREVERLQNGETISFHWGLYSGNAILDNARAAYFKRFQHLLLNDLDSVVVGQLRNLPATPSPNDPAEPAYDLLKAHLSLSSGSCKPDRALISRVLRGARSQLAPTADADWQLLADRQIEFYAVALSGGNPCKLTEDVVARDHARRYLLGIQGVDRIYRGIIADADRALTKAQRLDDLAPNWKQVLSGKVEVNAAFTQEGWHFVEAASKKAGNTGALGEACVIGSGFGSPVKQDASISTGVQQLFIREYIEQWRSYIAGFSVVPYKSPADAAQKLNILADHKSPLLALFEMTASQTNFPVTTTTSALEKVPILGEAFKKGEKAAQVAASLSDAPAKLNIADITGAFQPVAWVTPPGSETWVVDKNSAYVAALAQLAHSMQDIAASSNPDPAVYQAASQNQGKALDAARQIASGFKPMGVGALDVEVQRLLEEPIRLTMRFIQIDTSKIGGDKINGELHNLCAHINNTLHKYPFQPNSKEDSSIGELTNVFAPSGGAIWKFAAGSLGDFVVKEGSQWKVKDPARKPQVTPDLVTFLNHAEAIADAFYPAGASQPQLTYTLRSNLSPAFGKSVFDLEIDGKSWNPPFQQQFSWPAPTTTANPGAIGQIRGSFSYPFENRRGVWGVFRMFGDAEPRRLLTKVVEWKYSLVGDGPKVPIQPEPVRLEILQFPGGYDLFNPDFFLGIGCPSRAIQ